jgi:hypothetical protein
MGRFHQQDRRALKMFDNQPQNQNQNLSADHWSWIQIAKISSKC